MYRDASEIPEYIERLKKHLGIKLVPPRNHCLYGYFIEFERWAAAEGSLTAADREIPDSVVYLATLAARIDFFQESWSNRKALRVLRSRLSAEDPANVLGLAFEFQAGTHFKQAHPKTRWLPNAGIDSQLDLEIETQSGKKVLVECTHKQPKPLRFSQPWVLYDDILITVEAKKKQMESATAAIPAVLTLLIPEEIDWKSYGGTHMLDNLITNLFHLCKLQYLSGISIVSYRRPRLQVIELGLPPHKNDLPVIVWRNRHAIPPLPDDFRMLI